MIDWVLVAFSGLWIIGLSFVFAALSFAYYLGSVIKLSFKLALDLPKFDRFGAGILLPGTGRHRIEYLGADPVGDSGTLLLCLVLDGPKGGQGNILFQARSKDAWK
jgi:hypothetical protein